MHTETDFFQSISFPAIAELGLRVNKLGKTSVRYEAALFEKGKEDVRAVGGFIHVVVDRETGRPAVNGINTQLRDGLEKLLVKDNAKL